MPSTYVPLLLHSSVVKLEQPIAVVTFIGYFEAASASGGNRAYSLGVRGVGTLAGLLAPSPMTRNINPPPFAKACLPQGRSAGVLKKEGASWKKS